MLLMARSTVPGIGTGGAAAGCSADKVSAGGASLAAELTTGCKVPPGRQRWATRCRAQSCAAAAHPPSLCVTAQRSHLPRGSERMAALLADRYEASIESTGWQDMRQQLFGQQRQREAET